MSATSSHDLAERLAGLERTVERLMGDCLRLQQQVKQSSRANYGKSDGGLSFWKRMAFRRGSLTPKPAIRENKRVHPMLFTGETARHS
ncbi:MAG TPA: hypothetical protein VJ692_01210 [Nitrospiraceae bacterium]|nr:hypothetical protein [Nitrospiraceae bacterium]